MRDITNEMDTDWEDLIFNWVLINDSFAMYVRSVEDEGDEIVLHGQDVEGDPISYGTSSIRSLSS